MTNRHLVLPCIAMVTLAAAPAFATNQQDDPGKNGHGCRAVHGEILEVQIETQTGEPRVLGPVSGALAGANSSTLILSSLVIGPGGVIDADTIDTFVTKDGDMLVANGHATFTPIPGAAPGEVTDSLILTVDGSKSTGKFKDKVGTIQVVGVGHQFPPNPAFGGPGKTSFELSYAGQICRP